LDQLAAHTSPALAERAAHWQRQTAGLTSAEKLALIDVSLPWLRRLTPEEGESLIATTEALIAADGTITIFEFLLQQVIARHVAIALGLRRPAPVRYRQLRQVAEPAQAILQAVAAVSSSPTALAAAETDFRVLTGHSLQAGSDRLAWPSLTTALRELEAATPPVKESLLRLAGMIVLADQRIEDTELELVRALAEAVGAPVPPFLRTAQRAG
jgi:hypothetical protein